MSAITKFGYWLCNDPRFSSARSDADAGRVDPVRLGGFVAIHLGCLAVIFVGWSPAAVAVATGLYFVRMFFVTAFYHRYFSHRAFRVNRAVQFVMAVLGCTAGQRGPLWWASYHRHHHANADTEADPHSPRHHGFWHSHTVWFLTRGRFAALEDRVRDWERYPELKWLERFDWLPFIGLGVLCWFAGESAHGARLGTSGAELLVWGFFISTVLLYHGTYTVNSLAHRFGVRRFETRDDSRNNPWLVLITLGEGWHNNHHRYPGAARQGFYWWEIDPTFVVLKILSWTGLVRGLKPVPAAILAEGRSR